MEKQKSDNTLTLSEVNQDFAKARKALKNGPLIITTRGEPSLVLMTYSNYIGQVRRKPNLVDRLQLPMIDSIEVEFPPLIGSRKPSDVD